MSDTVEFVNGLLVKAPSPKAPDFVKANISIKVADLQEWLNKQEGEWVNIDVKEARGGRWYACVSNFKPKPATAAKKSASNASGGFQDFESDIPFSPIGRGVKIHSL